MYTCAYSANRYDYFFPKHYINQVIWYQIMTFFTKHDKHLGRKMPFTQNSENGFIAFGNKSLQIHGVNLREVFKERIE